MMEEERCTVSLHPRLKKKQMTSKINPMKINEKENAFIYLLRSGGQPRPPAVSCSQNIHFISV
jgi:hypothetical protein